MMEKTLALIMEVETLESLIEEVWKKLFKRNQWNWIHFVRTKVIPNYQIVS